MFKACNKEDDKNVNINNMRKDNEGVDDNDNNENKIIKQRSVMRRTRK